MPLTRLHSADALATQLSTQWLHDLTHASASDDCTTSHPKGRHKRDWEHGEQCDCDFPDHRRHCYGGSKPPEEVAYAHLGSPSGETLETSSLAFCRFKRDVWLMARMFIEDVIMYQPQRESPECMERLQTHFDVEKYERVFSMDPSTMPSPPEDDAWGSEFEHQVHSHPVSVLQQGASTSYRTTSPPIRTPTDSRRASPALVGDARSGSSPASHSRGSSSDSD